jgi:hypothetical protein
MEEFERAKVFPENQQRYIEELTRGDARLIASGNLAVATEFSEKRGNPESTLASRVRGASIEDLDN